MGIGKKITRIPDRQPSGKYPAFVDSAEIVTRTSQKGITYESVQIGLLVLNTQFGMTVRMNFFIPLFWNDESTLVRVLRAFGILPEVGEEADLEELLHKIVEVTIEEKAQNGKVYSIVTDMVPFFGKVHPVLKELFDRHTKARLKSEVIFDDEDDSGSDEPEEIDDEPDEPVSPEPPKQTLRHFPHGPVKKKPGGTRPAPSKPFNDEDEDLGDL